MTERLISAELRGEVRRRDDERRLRKMPGVSGDEQGIVALRGKSYGLDTHTANAFFFVSRAFRSRRSRTTIYERETDNCQREGA